MKIHQKIRLLTCSLIGSVLFAGCNGAAGGFAGLGSKKQKSNSSNAGGQVTVSADVSQGSESQGPFDIDSPEVLENIAATSTEEYLAAAIESATNDIFDIGGYIISDVKDTLTLYEPELMALADKYPTFGDFIDSRSGDRYAPIDMDGVANGLALAEAFIMSGSLEEASLPSDSDQTETTEATNSSDQTIGFSLQKIDREAAREAKLFALTVAAIRVGTQSGLYLGNYDNPSGNVVKDCMVGVGGEPKGFMTVDWKLDESCMCQHYPHGCKMAEESGKPKYCTGAPTPNDVGYDKDCPAQAQ